MATETTSKETNVAAPEADAPETVDTETNQEELVAKANQAEVQDTSETDSDDEDVETEDTSESDSNQESNSQLDVEAARKELDKARKQAARYRKSLRDLETRIENEKKEREKEKMGEIERLRVEKQEVMDALEKRNSEIKLMQTKASLTGKVADVDVAIKLLNDDFLDDDGNVDLEYLFATYPILKPQPKPEPPAKAREVEAPKPKPVAPPPDAPRVPSAQNVTPPPITRDEVKNMDSKTFAQRRAEIYNAIKEGRYQR